MDVRVSVVVLSNVIAWLSLTGLFLPATIVRAENALEDHRLFFTEAQRQAVEHESPIASSSELPKSGTQEQGESDRSRAAVQSASKSRRVSGRSLDPVSSERRPVAMARERDPEDRHQVYFTALVTGQRGARVLVNGLPCRFAIVQHPGHAGVPVPIDCPGVQNEALSLTMSASHAELGVTDAAGRVYRLQPGEGL